MDRVVEVTGEVPRVAVGLSAFLSFEQAAAPTTRPRRITVAVMLLNDADGPWG
ncbi:MAG: hypothetical protein KDB02_09025 [Acidimicrobiales bacterium]|nr:hypothetical protein [Acidimicrobiales bacterium]